MTTKPRLVAKGTIADLRDRITSEGIEAAYEALVAVCSDKQAPAQARATASTTLFRAAGLLERYEEPAEKEMHEMSAAELNELVRKGEAVINAQYDAMIAERDKAEQDDDESFLN